jgi:chemotaxis family two-component system response regulator Rcp1
MPMRSFRILLVEDSASDARLFREALQEVGVTVHLVIVRDGMEATDYFRQADAGLKGRPDLVVLDWNLPRKSGSEVLKEIKASPTLKPIPVIVMTSSDAADDIRVAYSLNANAYVTKPNSLMEYINVARSIEDFWFMTAILPENYPRTYSDHRARLAS